jgi:hypothetical protein
MSYAGTLTIPVPPAEVDYAGWRMRDLLDYVGGLSAPSKMPCWGYSLPAAECIAGTRLRKVEGSTCSDCYAMKGRYAFPKVKAALYRRLDSIAKPYWAEVMAELIRRKGNPYFRWHDSGDLQSAEHFAAIVRVCEMTPDVSHWIPTREYRIVQEHVESGGDIPANLSVRMSAHMVGGTIPTFPRLPMVTVSTVSKGEPPAGAHRCPAPHQGNSCGDCRACWSTDIRLVDYALH